MNHRTNDQIRASPIRVVAADGSRLGVMPIADALKKAIEAGLDLVEVGTHVRPPVCRIMDYGKFQAAKAQRMSDQEGGFEPPG